jgi:oligopeptide/dipeptide ABC transporter ATP-binding protein
LAGETGCGKSVTAMSLLRLLPEPPGQLVNGSARFKGTDLYQMPEEQLRELCLKEIAMIFQHPISALNPYLSIGTQIAEIFSERLGFGRKEAKGKALSLLHSVGIRDAVNRFDAYPEEFSGGMCQRVVIAMALSCNPRLIIADEPTTDLDSRMQARILKLLRDITKTKSTALLLISHDLGIIESLCTHVYVMYAGRIVESASTDELFTQPLHPYSLALLSAAPPINKKVQRLYAIPGSAPDPLQADSGCAFYPRCTYRKADCKKNVPPLRTIRGTRLSACLFAEQFVRSEI